MTLELFLMALLLGVPAYYVLEALLLERKDDHEGPFATNHLTVLFPEIVVGNTLYPEHKQRVALWDWMRRLFGVYTIDGNTWIVNEKHAERWTCSFCLSFWTSIPFTLFFCVTSGIWTWVVFVHLGIAVVSQLVYRIFDAR